MTDNAEKKKNAASRFLPLIVIALALAAFFALGLQRYFSLDALRDNRERLRAFLADNPALAMGAFVLVYAGAVAISFPGASIMTVFGGFLFGLWPGVPLIVIGATLGACAIFVAAKTALGDFLGRRAGGLIKRMEDGFREDELSYLFFLRLAPIFPFWAVNIGAGVLGVRLRNFFIGTLIGIVPGSFVYASIGNAAATAFDAGEDVTLQGVLFKPEVLLPFVGLALLSLLPVVLKRMRAAKGKRTS
ncbi:MAG TPA: TVP38/TMEM64 family protein [Parvularculaceae bacterium]|nr:TVP38/TMEM64 family protein [Parvularculaceae bacterium]